MRESDHDQIFAGISKMCQILISEADNLCDLIDEDSDFEVCSRHIASLEDEADNIRHDLQYYYQENKLFRNPEALVIMEIISSVEKCTDIIDDIAKIFIRLNITDVKDNIVSSFMSAGTGAVKMAELINTIRRLNKADTPIKDIIELDHYKVEYRRIYDLNMNKLYVDGNDPIEVMRWTKVYDSFKELFDSYEAVAECCGRYCIYMD
ncbi:MAG: DUF47 family protein [Clostridiales bacterium]|nr:DUF47 family protein [Clostridiales bacterium]